VRRHIDVTEAAVPEGITASFTQVITGEFARYTLDPDATAEPASDLRGKRYNLEKKAIGRPDEQLPQWELIISGPGVFRQMPLMRELLRSAYAVRRNPRPVLGRRGFHHLTLKTPDGAVRPRIPTRRRR
jgi:hypothetical protein